MSSVTTKRFTVDEYHQLAEIGFLQKSDRIELIRGEIVHMASKGLAHEVCITELNEQLINCVSGKAKVRCQSPIALPPDSEPEPDFTIVRNRLDRYMISHPKPDDILLVIEISDSSITYDQTVKLSTYAESSTADYWIFNLLDEILECYSEPYQSAKGEWAYRSKRIYLPTDSVAIDCLSDKPMLLLQKSFPPER